MEKTRNFKRRYSKRKSTVILKQIFICILIITVIIGIKKINILAANNALAVFENQIQKEYKVSTLYDNTVTVIKKIPEIPETIYNKISMKKKQFAFNPPTDSENIISTFGESYDSASQSDSFQRGINYSSEKEMQVYTIGSGIVTEVSSGNQYGQYIKVNHGNETFSIYGGCTDIYVKPMQKVKTGEIIASVRSGGNNELHFELWVNGEIVNPAQYIDFK